MGTLHGGSAGCHIAGVAGAGLGVGGLGGSALRYAARQGLRWTARGKAAGGVAGWFLGDGMQNAVTEVCNNRPELSARYKGKTPRS